MTHLFCSIEPSPKGYQDLVCIVWYYSGTLYSGKWRCFFISVGPYLPSSHQLHTWVFLGVFQPLQPMCASGWSLLALKPPSLRCKSPRAPTPCPKSPCTLSSTVLVVETIKIKPCQPQCKSLTMMLTSEHILSIGKILLTSQAASQGSQPPLTEAAVFSLLPCNSFGEES